MRRGSSVRGWGRRRKEGVVEEREGGGEGGQGRRGWGRTGKEGVGRRGK